VRWITILLCINKYLGVRPRLLSTFVKIHKVWRAENFSATEQNLCRIRVSEQNFAEQNKWFLRALPTGRISHFTSRIYPSLRSRLRIQSHSIRFRSETDYSSHTDLFFVFTVPIQNPNTIQYRHRLPGSYHWTKTRRCIRQKCNCRPLWL